MSISFPDAIHGSISISERYAPTLKSVALTRLRNIKQLGFTSSLYTGAVHTRFEHTLGTVAVLDRMLAQFGVSSIETRDRYVLSALISEIGIYPMSYSARSVFDDGPDAKEYYKELVFKAFLKHELDVSWDEEAAFSQPDAENHQWFREVPGMEDFGHLTPVKLASTIDYVLRDAHYSGRYSGMFDYRYFGTISPDGGEDTRRELKSALKELHRAAHLLNSIYGDRVRRFLTLMLLRLCQRLSSNGFLDLEKMKQIDEFIELDDDAFFALIGKAATQAEKIGDEVSVQLFDIINRKRAVEVHPHELDGNETDMSATELELHLADKFSVTEDRVFCLGSRLKDKIGFRLFGREFDNYNKAVTSDYFSKLTGLNDADDRTGLERDGVAFYTII